MANEKGKNSRSKKIHYVTMNSNGNMKTFQLLHVFVSISRNECILQLNGSSTISPLGNKMERSLIRITHVLIIKPTKKKEMNAFHDHQQIKHMYFMLAHLQYDVHILQLNALQGTPSHLQHPPILCSFIKNRMFTSHVIFLWMLFNTKIYNNNSNIFQCKFFYTVKITYSNRKLLYESKITNQRLNLKLITNQSTLEHQKKVDPKIMNK